MCIQIKIGSNVRTFNDKLEAISFINQQDNAYINDLRKSLSQANKSKLTKRAL